MYAFVVFSKKFASMRLQWYQTPIRILGRSLWKSSFIIKLQACRLNFLKVKYLHLHLQGFCQLCKNTKFKEHIPLAAFAIYFYKLCSLRVHWFDLCVIEKEENLKYSSEAMLKWFKTGGITFKILCEGHSHWGASLHKKLGIKSSEV